MAFTLSAAAVVAVKATRADTGAGLPARDLLVLHPRGRLALYVGARHVCGVSVRAPAAPQAGAAQSLIRSLLSCLPAGETQGSDIETAMPRKLHPAQFWCASVHQPCVYLLRSRECCPGLLQWWNFSRCAYRSVNICAGGHSRRLSRSGSGMDMSDASMGASDGGVTPMAQSPQSDDVPAASGPDVAALGEALEAPLEFTDLKASITSAGRIGVPSFVRCMLSISTRAPCCSAQPYYMPVCWQAT